MATKDKNYKVFKYSTSSNTGLQIGEDWLTITSEKERQFLTIDKKGVSLGGPLNLQGTSGQIKLGGIAHLNGHLTSFLPSNMANPQPLLKVDTDFFKGMADMAITAIGMMALIGS